jgi:DNA (cytosine-5)-methyltransferase 1
VVGVKLGSLFDGSGTAPLAATMCGIVPVWASEIEPYPIKVTKARFPNMEHLGSILGIDGAAVEPVDIICGGSPCQDLSVAGKQKGLQEGERSHLFFEMTRVIKQMREATNGKYPRYVIWENVPGAFSSNKGRDFLAVLQAFAEIADPDIHVPEPKQKASKAGLAWKYAGYVAGDGWSIAWRTVDAQYWGVPQRRSRIYLVADFGGERADEILFERTGMPGDSEPGGAQREETAGDAGRSAAGSGDFSRTSIARTFIARHDSSPYIDRGQNIAFHLQQDPISNESISPCIGGKHQSTIGVASFMGGQGAKARSIAYCDDGTTPTIKSVMSGGNTVPDVVYSMQGNCIDRNAAQNGSGYAEGVSHTINGTDRHGIVFAIEGDGNTRSQIIENVSLCMKTVHPNSIAASVGNGQLHQISTSEQSNCFDCMHDQQAVLHDGIPPRKYIVRRLTPLECCRLQGFPDWWEDGVEGSDSARYKMWGNGMALPNMLHVMRGIARAEQWAGDARENKDD